MILVGTRSEERALCLCVQGMPHFLSVPQLILSPSFSHHTHSLSFITQLEQANLCECVRVCVCVCAAVAAEEHARLLYHIV